MDKVLQLTYSSALTELCELNSSFDSGILRICYTGENRNGSYLSKEAIEENIPTLYNCPIVCNYDRETDTLGGHDVQIVRDDDNGYRLVNLTQPVGVIPESAKVWFEDYTEEDGTVHEYLYAEVLLWKRQEAYKKIKEDGITAHSMEINVKEAKTIDGVYHIEDFEFTAFALIGVEPCFESSALETFSKQDFKTQLEDMMAELKESFTQVNTFNRDDIHPQENTMKGGETLLDDKATLVQGDGVSTSTADFDNHADTSDEPKAEPTEPVQNDTPDASEPSQTYDLASNVLNEIERGLEGETITDDWGYSYPRYWFIDADLESHEAYCVDWMDGLLYGFSFTLDGDSVVIDFDSKQRKKWAIVDFDGGTQDSPFTTVFSAIKENMHELHDTKEKFDKASERISALEKENKELLDFKNETETAKAKQERDSIFEQFKDLDGNETFEKLKEESLNYELDVLEEKCYAIRGRLAPAKNFSLNNDAPRLKVTKSNTDNEKEPYGGLFVKYNTADSSK